MRQRESSKERSVKPMAVEMINTVIEEIIAIIAIIAVQKAEAPNAAITTKRYQESSSARSLLSLPQLKLKNLDLVRSQMRKTTQSLPAKKTKRVKAVTCPSTRVWEHPQEENE